jgi:hypothetical protein
MNMLWRWVDQNWRILTLLIWLGITMLSLMPLPELPSLPGTDKTHHLLAYAVLVFPVALHKARGWLYFALGFVMWSGVIELVQPYVNRYAEWLDLLANAAGVIVGVLIASVVRRANKSYL